MKSIIDMIKKHDSAPRSTLEIIFTYPGLWAVLFHRPAHWLYRHNLFFLARLIQALSRFFTGIEIHPGANIGKGLFIDHGMGTVIGETAIVGDYVILYHGVTLGSTGKEEDTDKRHPTVEDHVFISAHSQIVGNITVGEHSIVGAGAVVLEDVPAHTTVAGIPAKVVRKHKDDETI